MVTPVGFWSYARQDDAHSDGHLSQLRVIIGKAIGLRYGGEVTLWQDVTAIPFGADWEKEIGRTVGQTTFFVPIVTPRFLRSTHCHQEYVAFRARMEALGRDDLVFPIHYVDIDDLEPADTVFADDLTRLRGHQWIDFRPFLHTDPRSHEMRAQADVFAKGILLTMRRVAEDERRAVEARARRQAERQAADAKAREDAERQAAETEAKEEADRLAAESMARDEANARDEAERHAAAAKAREDAERQAAEARAKDEAERVAAEAKAQEDAERREAEAKAREDAACAEAEARAKEAARVAAEKTAREEAARRQAEAQAREDAARAEAKAKEAEHADAEAKARRDAEQARARADAERRSAEAGQATDPPPTSKSRRWLLAAGGSTVAAAAAVLVSRGRDTNARAGAPLATFQNGNKDYYVFDVAFVPNSRTAIFSPTGAVKLLDLDSGRLLRTFDDAGAPVAVAPDGLTFLCSNNDSTEVRIVKLDGGNTLRTLPIPSKDVVIGVAIAPDGAIAAVGTHHMIEVWGLATGQIARSLRGHKDDVGSIAIASDSKTAISGSSDKTVRLWDLSTGRNVSTFDGQTNPVAISPDGTLGVSAAGPDDTYALSLLNLKTGAVERSLRGHAGRIASVAIAPDGKTALSGSFDQTLKLWDLATGRELRTFIGHTGSVYSVAIAPDGKTALSGSADGTLKLWGLT